MFRLMSVILLMGGLAAQMPAQTPKDLAGQIPATEQGGAGQAPAEQNAAAPAKSQYPLDSFTEFSAIMVGTSIEIGEGTDEAHIYRSGNLIRTQGPEGHGYFITDLNTHDTYGISAASCIHDTRAYVRASPFAGVAPDSKVERVAAGKETMDGHPCQIEDLTISSPKRPNPLKMRLWEAEDLQGFPVRIDVQRGQKVATIHYKNVVLGPQDPTLFLHPNSCGPIMGHELIKPKVPAAGKKPAATTPPQ